MYIDNEYLPMTVAEQTPMLWVSNEMDLNSVKGEFFVQNLLENSHAHLCQLIWDKYGSFCRLKVDESSTLKNKDKLSIIFSKNKDDYQHQQLIQSMNFTAIHQQQNIEYL